MNGIGLNTRRYFTIKDNGTEPYMREPDSYMADLSSAWITAIFIHFLNFVPLEEIQSYRNMLHGDGFWGNRYAIS